MFLKKVRHKKTTYYYLMRRAPDNGRQEQLTVFGSIEDASAYKEEELFKAWIMALMAGGEQSYQSGLKVRKEITKARLKDCGRNFDLQKCLREFRAINEKYGHLSKQLLEKKARPNGDLSWGTTTILNQLRNRGLSLSQAFEKARADKNLQQSDIKKDAHNPTIEETPERLTTI